MSDADSKAWKQEQEEDHHRENGERIHAPIATSALKNHGDDAVFQMGLAAKKHGLEFPVATTVKRRKDEQQQLGSSNTAFRPLPSAPRFLAQGFKPFQSENPCSSPMSSVQSSHPGAHHDNHGREEDDDEENQGDGVDKKKTPSSSTREWGNQPLSVLDPKLWDLMEHEKCRQWKGIELIASENYTSQAVLEALGSHLTNKYSEGYPGARCYGGNEYIDQIETLCCNRALEAFHLDASKWGVNVQPYSCTSANFAVFTALLQPKDRIMGLDVLSGGHPSHGYTIAGRKKISATSIHFETLAYSVDPQTGLIDYENLERLVSVYRPAILICGGSAYPREWKYETFRHLSDRYGAILMCDMAHISGLVATQECDSPFEHCDIVTSTTHKILRGPRGGMVFFRKGTRPRRNGGATDDNNSAAYDYEEKINFTIFRSLQGGPHNNHIAALAVALKQAASKEYKDYIKQVLRNTKTLADAMIKRNFKLVTGGTDNHLLIWDLRPLGITGGWFEKVTELCHITVNKCTVYGDNSARGPGGIRIGSPAMTSRGCVEKDFETIAEILSSAVAIAQSLQRDCKSQKDPKFSSVQSNREVAELKRKVEHFSSAFEMPGFDTRSMKYR